jgi:DNA-binding PadR family transcriptional regulator
MTARGRHRSHEPHQAHEPSHAHEPDEGGQTPRSRGLNPVYELFVLGELMVQPMYGYQLHEVVNKALGPFHHLSWGTLYPLIRRLEYDRLATSHTEQKHGFFSHGTRTQGQARRVYQITEAGRERFFALMLDPGEYCRATPDLFAIKLTKFGFLTLEQRLLVLHQYRGYLSYLRRYWQSGQDEISGISDITDSERPFIVQLFDHHLHTLDAEISWIDAQIARLTEEEARS